MSPSKPRRGDPRVTLAVLSMAGLAYAVLSSSVVPALPTIQHDLNASETGVTWLLTGYLLSASVGTAIIGRLGDMYGKEHVLLWTLVVLAAGTLLAAVSHTLALLIAARVIQGVAGGIYPLAFGIIRDEFPRERVAGSIGFISAILGIGAGIGIVSGAIVVEHLSWNWLFWLPLAVVVAAGFCTWRFIPESPVRVPGRINWLAAALMTIGISTVLIAISETTTWGWGSSRTAGLLAAGLAVCTAGMYSAFIVFPQFAQLPTSTGFGFGASVVASGLYLLPSTIAMMVVGMAAGPIAARFGSKAAVIVGSIFAAAAFGLIAAAHDHPYEMLLSAALMGIGIGLAFAALGNLVVQAVPAHQTGAAGGMNTVMRTIGGAIGGQLAATLIADNTGADGLPAVTGFTETFVMATVFLIVCALTGLLIPGRRPAAAATELEPALALADP
jgi:MFS family permease